MKVIPVIDILNGAVVHAVRGQRSQYKPLQSNLTESSEPLKVAIAFKNLGFTTLYIADLDAIITCGINFSTLQEIAVQTGLQIMVDAGVTSIDRAKHLLDSGVKGLVIGTETLQNMRFVEDAVDLFGADRVIVSLDLKYGKIILKEEFDGPKEPFALLKEFKRIGVKQVIVLDLVRVGSGEGVDVDFLKRVIAEVGVDVFVGGGVRNIGDLKDLNQQGIKGALIATALHNGEIPCEELKEEGFL